MRQPHCRALGKNIPDTCLGESNCVGRNALNTNKAPVTFFELGSSTTAQIADWCSLIGTGGWRPQRWEVKSALFEN
jgi:hypothetical protein